MKYLPILRNVIIKMYDIIFYVCRDAFENDKFHDNTDLMMNINHLTFIRLTSIV